jgi:hypothetical protein
MFTWWLQGPSPVPGPAVMKSFIRGRSKLFVIYPGYA